MFGELIFQDSSKFGGVSFGYPKSVAGEVVFATGMTGYPESLTDPSYAGQILVLTYPLIGNYGVPEAAAWESDRIQVSGLIVSSYIDTPSHYRSRLSLGQWLRQQRVPALQVRDTRLLAQKLRDQGSSLGKIVISGKKDLEFDDPNQRNLVAEVSTRKVRRLGRGKKIVLLLDCGTKRNIIRSLTARSVRVVVVPWNYNIFSHKLKFDGLVISNGPGDPKLAEESIALTSEALRRRIPTLGICLGNQILTLAAGGNTKKMKFGHRSQNQPCTLVGTKRSYLTTQNHGYVVSRLPKGFRSWFVNANDGTNEGLIHRRSPLMSVQFHPEASPGPMDTGWIFDYFLKRI